jgi:hypothetical protein
MKNIVILSNFIMFYKSKEYCSFMNFLAHIYLSGESDEIKVGNFIGDYVKGKNWEKYPERSSEAFLLHRKIDSFTDRASRCFPQ